MEVLIALLALAIAWRQLALQRREIERNGKITALVNMSQMCRDKISFYSGMIDDLKTQGKPWTGHARVINQELRPALEQINKEIIDLTRDYKFDLSEEKLKSALRLQGQEPSVTGQDAG